MAKKLVINSNISETRIALIENDRTRELYVERHSHKGMVGNIYKGKVTRVLPGMQSAFVNIGVDRTAFLFGGDVLEPGFVKTVSEGREGEAPQSTPNRTPIEQILKGGQEIVVQVAKEPLGSKGPRVTMQIAVPGRYLVLMPDFDSLGVSRRIDDESRRDEIRKAVDAIRPEGMGLIVRTAAADVNVDLLQKDLNYLLGVWETIKEKKSKKNAPAQLYQEPNLVVKTTRDLYADDINEIIVDDPGAYSQLKHFLTDSIPGSDEKLLLYKESDPIFDKYDIEMDIAKALARKVWLPSGSYLVIDQTEALTAFDVNTGKYVGASNVQETILATNLEAAEEIVTQIRLRNLGGIIVVDFIDMENMEHRKKLDRRLKELLSHDKARTNLLPINELGIIELTRKRTRESIERTLMESCPYCSGRGRVRRVESEIYDLVRDIERQIIRTKQKSILVRLRADIKEKIHSEEMLLIETLKEKHGIDISFEVSGLALELLAEAPYEVI